MVSLITCIMRGLTCYEVNPGAQKERLRSAHGTREAIAHDGDKHIPWTQRENKRKNLRFVDACFNAKHQTALDSMLLG